MDERVVLFGRDYLYTGAVEMPAGQFFQAAKSLLRLQGDELRAISSDGLQGLLVDDLERENEIEFWCWGNRWIGMASSGS